MTRTELAESMAEFLGWDFNSNQMLGDWPVPMDLWVDQLGDIFNRNELMDFIFSPDGFFAVWDKVDKNPAHELIHDWFRITFGKSSIGTFNCCIPRVNHQEQPYRGSGPDRYTAFYEAVHEMKEGE